MRQGLALRLALALGTARFVPNRTLPPAEYALLLAAARSGWHLRRASPRWDAIWQPYAEGLSRQRVLILPDHGWGLTGIDWIAVVQARCARAGLTDGFTVAAPGTRHLRQAERRLHALIAPAWASASTDHGPGRKADT